MRGGVNTTYLYSLNSSIAEQASRLRGGIIFGLVILHSSDTFSRFLKLMEVIVPTVKSQQWETGMI